MTVEKSIHAVNQFSNPRNMHNNSPRMGIPLKSQTPPSIGPTTYIICDERARLKNRVPFLSTEEKTPKFIAKSFCDTLYSVTECSDIKLGSSPRNRAPRFAHLEDDTPGPGEYDPEEPGCREAGDSPSARGRLYVCRVPFTLKRGGPSIPTKVNENGYYLDEDGDVVPIPPTETKGCSFYNVAEKPAHVDRYKGCKWSQRTAQRSFSRPQEGPGPANYDVRTPGCARDAKNDEFREMARLMTFLPRFLDAQDMKSRKENLPGPGQYNVTSNRGPCKLWPAVFPKPFIAGSRRFEENVSGNPSPDAYNVAGSSKIRRTSLAPFDVGASRFSKRKTSKTPGPADYDIKSRFSKYRPGENESSEFRAPFNNSAVRNTIDMKKDVAETASPADYSVGDGGKCKIWTSSVFESKVNRFPKTCYELNEMSPARYNPTEAFNYSRNRQSHNVRSPPFNVVDRKHGAFDDINYLNPSPVDYQSQCIPINNKGHFIPITKRFADSRAKTPGPGTYWIHPYFDNSANRAYTSHNLKIREDILRTPLRFHTDDTREKWLGDLKKPKKMRWFLNEGKGFSHCV